MLKTLHKDTHNARGTPKVGLLKISWTRSEAKLRLKGRTRKGLGSVEDAG